MTRSRRIQTAATGQLSGVLADYLAAISKAYGITFQQVAYSDDIQLLNALKDGTVDIISPVGYTYGMAENSGVSITKPIDMERLLEVPGQLQKDRRG